MRKFPLLESFVIAAVVAASCSGPAYAQKTALAKNTTKAKAAKTTTPDPAKGFNVEADTFADLQLLRYQVPGFNNLSLKQKKLAYYLSEAALSGRDILYDQK